MKLFSYTPRQIIALAVISGLLLMENIDSNILNVAIPQMATTFATSIFMLKLAVTSYLIGLSVFIPISGWVADKIGTKYTLIFAVILFTIMSIQCGLTNSVSTLVICRLLQGLAGAFMVPVARLLLLKIFAKAQMVKAYTIMGLPVMLGPIIAPILGGYLVSYFSWRYIFWVNIPLGIIALYAIIRYVDNYTQEQESFNWLSFMFLALFLASVCFWLDICLLAEISLMLKSLLLVMAISLGVIYYLLERYSLYPVVRYRLFKLRTFSTCFFSTIIIRAALGGRSFMLAIFLEVTFKLSAFQAGFYFIYVSAGVLASRSLVRLLLERFGFRATLTFANLGSCGALILLACVQQLDFLFYVALFLNGIFSSAQFMSMNVLYYAEVEGVDYGSAVSLAATWQQIGMSLGIIVTASLLHGLNYIAHSEFSLWAFHWAFIGLALINLSCQFLINRLEVADGQNLLAGHKLAVN